MSRSDTVSPAKPARKTEVILQAQGLARRFQMGDATIDVLRHVDLALKSGEFVAIEGRSGSGKSTLLHIMGALDTCDGGSVLFDGENISTMPGWQRNQLRNESFGFIFQFYYLLPELNVLENTLLAPMVGHGVGDFMGNRGQLRQRAADLLEQLGLSHRLKHRPSHLSGGERQRVAIARALMNRPRILFADEPTGNLDNETGRQIMDVLEKLHRDQNQTIVMVTHDRGLAREADRVLVLRNGVLASAES